MMHDRAIMAKDVDEELMKYDELMRCNEIGLMSN
jgi:hypothetical protein